VNRKPTEDHGSLAQGFDLDADPHGPPTDWIVAFFSITPPLLTNEGTHGQQTGKGRFDT
jgi:hypothetical protein